MANNSFAFLTEKELMWAEMLEQVLKDNEVPCVAVPVFGAGMALKAGVQERHKLYVPKECLEKAKSLLDELFSSEALPLDPEDPEEE